MGKETWLWLADGLGYGAMRTGELLTAFPGGAEEVAANLGSELLDDLLTQKQAEKLASTRPEDFASVIARIEARGIEVLPFDDENYPGMLRNIFNPPLVLFVQGDKSLLNGQLSIGMVGARRPSAYGVEAVRAIGKGVALGGAIIVSGLAAGLDAEAHKAALAVNGPTVACIAFGHDTCYPAANKKLMEVIGRYGAVVSEYPLGTTAEKPFFLQRNRLIAGLSHGLVVAEARRQSGTMSTVNFATEYGRDVFAVPGSIFSELSEGTNAMIREGAYLAGSATDVLAVYGIELQTEDPVTAAAKQAAAGRPAPEEPPLWQQNMERQAALARKQAVLQSDEPGTEEAAAQQTLAEALRRELRKSGAKTDGSERITSNQAVEAFRRLQQTLPPTDDAEIDARNRALDEMVDAVSDSVSFSSSSKRSKKNGKKPPQQPVVEPFPWHKVEHLSKEEMEHSRQPRAGRRKASQTSRPAPPVVSQRPVESIGAVSPVAAVEPVMPVAAPQAVEPAAALQPVQQGAVDGRPPTAQRQQSAASNTGHYDEVELHPPETPAPLPPAAAPPPKTAPPAAPEEQDTSPFASLNNFLRSRNGAPGEPEAETAPSWDMEGEEEVEDATALLSDNARRALEQLGPQPVSLSNITERSGLSSGEAMAALTELELAGLSRQLAGRQFVIMM